MLGRVDGGKSTLVGVLTQGRLDNGQGLARMQVSGEVGWKGGKARKAGSDGLLHRTSLIAPLHYA